MAFFTLDVDVGQEVHLDLDRSVSRTVLAATALDIERKTSRSVSAFFRFDRLGEEGSNFVEDTRVGGRVRTRGASDRCLIDVDDLVKIVESRN